MALLQASKYCLSDRQSRFSSSHLTGCQIWQAVKWDTWSIFGIIPYFSYTYVLFWYLSAHAERRSVNSIIHAIWQSVKFNRLLFKIACLNVRLTFWKNRTWKSLSLSWSFMLLWFWKTITDIIYKWREWSDRFIFIWTGFNFTGTNDRLILDQVSYWSKSWCCGNPWILHIAVMVGIASWCSMQ